ncbi:MAG: dienelactone hydrolase family protein [Thermoanaerobaculia bacterium]
MRGPLILSLIALGLPALAACGEAASDSDLVERMAREHATDEPVPSPAAQVEPAGRVASEEVVYADLEGTAIRGYLARPESGGELPGILVIQEWWGLNDNIRAMADRLAGEGYLALAVDLYEGEVADDREGAARLMRRSMERPVRLEENLRQAAAFLRQGRGVTRLGVIGWCFGGGWSLRTALLLRDQIDAAVIYYGRLVTEPAELEPLQAPILGLFGGLDRGIPVEAVRAFEAALRALGKEATIQVYDDANHAFANPSGTRYNQAAATDAWEKTLDFFERHLK